MRILSAIPIGRNTTPANNERYEKVFVENVLYPIDLFLLFVNENKELDLNGFEEFESIIKNKRILYDKKSVNSFNGIKSIKMNRCSLNEIPYEFISHFPNVERIEVVDNPFSFKRFMLIQHHYKTIERHFKDTMYSSLDNAIYSYNALLEMMPNINGNKEVAVAVDKVLSKVVYENYSEGIVEINMDLKTILEETLSEECCLFVKNEINLGNQINEILKTGK